MSGTSLCFKFGPAEFKDLRGWSDHVISLKQDQSSSILLHWPEREVNWTPWVSAAGICADWTTRFGWTTWDWDVLRLRLRFTESWSRVVVRLDTKYTWIYRNTNIIIIKSAGWNTWCPDEIKAWTRLWHCLVFRWGLHIEPQYCLSTNQKESKTVEDHKLVWNAWSNSWSCLFIFDLISLIWIRKSRKHWCIEKSVIFWKTIFLLSCLFRLRAFDLWPDLPPVSMQVFIKSRWSWCDAVSLMIGVNVNIQVRITTEKQGFFFWKLWYVQLCVPENQNKYGQLMSAKCGVRGN